jgi:AcrR family transcriptional regulator
VPRTGLPADQLKMKAIAATLARMRLVGFEKVRLSDVARDIGISHAALYAHFTDKAALLDAVTEQWLCAAKAATVSIGDSHQPAERRIVEWFVRLYQIKRTRALDDPELYRAFDIATALDKPFVIAHLDGLLDQLSELVSKAGLDLGVETPRQTAILLYRATAAFHHPTMIAQTFQDDLETDLRKIVDLLLRGIKAE